MKTLMAKSIEEVSESINQMNNKLEEINDKLRNLEKLPSQIKVMEAKQDLISKIKGYKLKAIKVDKGYVSQI